MQVKDSGIFNIPSLIFAGVLTVSPSKYSMYKYIFIGDHYGAYSGDTRSLDYSAMVLNDRHLALSR